MVFCPYEPKNLVLKSKLDEHLKTCPKKLELERMQKKKWYSKDINYCNPEYPSSFDDTKEDRYEN